MFTYLPLKWQKKLPTFVSFLAKPNAFAARSRASWNRFLKLRNATCTDCLRDKRTLIVQRLPVLLAHMLHGIQQLFPEPTLCHWETGEHQKAQSWHVLFFEQCLPFVACTHALWNNLHSDTCTVRLPEKKRHHMTQCLHFCHASWHRFLKLCGATRINSLRDARASHNTAFVLTMWLRLYNQDQVVAGSNPSLGSSLLPYLLCLNKVLRVSSMSNGITKKQKQKSN